MRVRMNSSGQITLPEEIRNQLGLGRDTAFDIDVAPDRTITLRAIEPDARRVRGLRKSSQPQALTVEDMDAGMHHHFRNRQAELQTAAARVRASLAPEFRQLDADATMRMIRGDEPNASPGRSQ